MPKVSGLAQLFCIEGYDLSGDVGALQSVSSPHATLDVPVLNKSGMVRIAGLSDGEISFNSWFDDASGLQFDATKGLPTADSVVLYALGGSVNDPAAMLVAKRIGYDWVRGTDGSLELTIAARSAAGIPLEWGVMLTSHTDSITASTSGSSVDDSASSSSGGSWIYQVTALSAVGGNARWHLNVQHSTNNSTWTDVSSATVTASDGIGAARATFTGTLNRYVRQRVVLDASSGSITYAIAYRRGVTEDDVDLS